MAPRQTPGNVVRIHEGVDTQRGDDGICVGEFQINWNLTQIT